MGKQRYTVTLDKELVDEAEVYSEIKEDRKISPILNHLLKEWITKKKSDQEILNKNKDGKK